MIMIAQQAINPVINTYGYDGLQLKIGLDTGKHSVIQYFIDKKPYADILGYGISMAAKLSSLAGSNEVVISHSIYMGMHSLLRKKFSPGREWNLTRPQATDVATLAGLLHETAEHHVRFDLSTK